ncbi:hypothetical protein D3C72_1842620 [compost metagenome]
MSIDFKETGALITAGEAILNPEYCEGFVTRAHEDRTVPGAAADVVHREDVVKAPLQITLIEGAAIAGRGRPPAFAHPATLGAIAQGHRNQVARFVADAQIGMGGRGEKGEACEHRADQGHAETGDMQCGASKHRKNVPSLSPW